MFEDLIAQARDIIRRLETNLGLSWEEFKRLPEGSKVRIDEAVAWDNVVRYAIAQHFGEQSDEMAKWQRVYDKHFEKWELMRSTGSRTGDNDCEHEIEKYAQLIAVLIEIDGKLKVARAAAPKPLPPIVVQGGVNMAGDTYYVGQAGAVGPSSQASNINFQQIWTQMQGSVDLKDREIKQPATPPIEPALRWWAPAVGAFATGVGAVTLTGLLLWNYQHPATILTGVFLTVFAVVYIIQIRHQTKLDHFAKYLAFLFAGAFVMLATMPALKVIADVRTVGRLEVLLDNSPWLAVMAVVGAIGFGAIQVYLQRSR